MIKEIEAELGRVFAPEQTACLVKVLDRIWQKEVERASDTRALQQGLTALTVEVNRLAAAQRRTEERLAEFEQRTEERFAALAEFQRRTEERVGRLEAAVERLAEAQARTEERVGRLEAAVERLAEAQARTEERLGRLEEAVERLAEAQARTEQRVEELAAAQARTEERLQSLVSVVADLRGWQLELRYQERARAYFGPLLRHLRVLSLPEMEEELEPHLPAAEYEDLLQVDLLLSGQPRHQPDAPLVWLVVEASAVVDRHDVERAQRRAVTLRQAGFRAIPTVAGERFTAGAEEMVHAGHLLVLRDGHPQFWKEALAAALAD